MTSREKRITFQHKIFRTLRNLYFSDDHEHAHSLKGVTTYFVRYFFHIFRELGADHCFLRASAMAFTTVLTLIPVLVLVFVLFGAIGGFKETGARAQQFLFRHLLPESVETVRNTIQNLLDSVNIQAVSAISIVLLLLAAFALFDSIDAALNTIWGTVRSSHWIRKIIMFWFILTVTPGLLGYSLYLSARIQDVYPLHSALFQTGLTAFHRFLPFLISSASLTLVYKLVPRTHVQWGSALIGGCFSGVFWELSKYGLNYYVRHFSNIALLYGSFLALPVFLIWVALSWIIILAGAEIAYTHQHLDRLHSARKRKEHIRDNPGILSDKLGFYLYMTVVEHFLNGRSIDRVSLLTRIPGFQDMAELLIDGMAAKGYLFIDSQGRMIPGNDVSAMRANAIFEYFEPDLPGEYFRGFMEPLDSADRVLRIVREIRNSRLGETTIRSLVIGKTEEGVAMEDAKDDRHSRC